MKSLLCATDYSINSVPALKIADTFSRKLNCPLYVIHVFDISATFISTVSIAYARMEEANFKKHAEKLREFCRTHINREPDGKNLISIVKEGSIASNCIIEVAEEKDVGMIFVGKKGSTMVKDLLIGSTATALIDKAQAPLLVIPETYQSHEIKTIVYATAFEQADIFAIREIAEWAENFDAEIKLFHVSTKSEYAGEDQMAWFKEMLQQQVKYGKMSFELRFAEDIFESLKSYLDEVKPDFLAMLEREGSSLITSLWHRDLVKRMKLETDIPLLSFPKKLEIPS